MNSLEVLGYLAVGIGCSLLSTLSMNIFHPPTHWLNDKTLVLLYRQKITGLYVLESCDRKPWTGWLETLVIDVKLSFNTKKSIYTFN